MKNGLFLFLIFSLAAICGLGQDLGSSNKLFGGSKAGSAKKAEKKKVSAKPKAVAAKPKSERPAARLPRPPIKRTATTSKIEKKDKTPAVKTASPAKSKFTEFGDGRPSTLTITPSQTKPAPLAKTKPADSTIAKPSSSGKASNESYEDLIEAGNAEREDRNYAAAEAAYKRARAMKANDSRAIYGLGNIYNDQQRWEEAETSYRTALQLDPGNAIANIALSYVLTQPIAVPNLSDRYEEAEKVARKAIQQAPSNPLAFDQLGVALELRGLIGEETENAYRRAITLDPAFAPPYAHLGRLLRRRGLAREADTAYKNAAERSKDVATMVLVAEVLQSEQRFGESEGLLRKALAEDPKNQSALLLLGRALTTQGNYAGAEQALRTSLETNPNGFMANSLLGSLFVRQGKYETAENSLLQALRFVTNLEKRRLSQQFEAVGDGYLKSGKARNAERNYRQAMTLDSENESLAAKLARAQRG